MFSTFDGYDPCVYCPGEKCERGDFCVYNGFDGYGASFEECQPEDTGEPPVCQVCGSADVVSWTTKYCIEHIDELPF